MINKTISIMVLLFLSIYISIGSGGKIDSKIELQNAEQGDFILGSININKSEVINIHAWTNSKEPDIVKIYLYNQTSLLAQDDPRSSGAERSISYNAQNPGKYIVKANMALINPGDFEPCILSMSSDQNISLIATYNRRISMEQGDTVLYDLKVNKRELLFINAHTNNSNDTMELYVYSPAGNMVSSSYQEKSLLSGYQPSIDYITQDSGTYTVKAVLSSVNDSGLRIISVSSNYQLEDNNSQISDNNTQTSSSDSKPNSSQPLNSSLLNSSLPNSSTMAQISVTPIPTMNNSTNTSIDYVFVNSIPSGADTFIDGNFKGITPIKLNKLSPESTLRLRLDGYKEWQGNINTSSSYVPVLLEPTAKSKLNSIFDSENINSGIDYKKFSEQEKENMFNIHYQYAIDNLFNGDYEEAKTNLLIGLAIAEELNNKSLIQKTKAQLEKINEIIDDKSRTKLIIDIFLTIISASILVHFSDKITHNKLYRVLLSGGISATVLSISYLIGRLLF